MKKGLLFLSAGMLVLASCGRYEEGPGFTLRSKKGRLAGDWKVTEITENGSTTVNGEPTLPSGYSFDMSFEKDGNFSFSQQYPGETADNEKGTWELKDDSLVLVYPNDNNYRESLRIVRMTNSELWLDDTYTDPSDQSKEVTQYKFESK
jgi:hypothetical protein